MERIIENAITLSTLLALIYLFYTRATGKTISDIINMLKGE